MSIEPNHYCRICNKQFYACDSCDKKLGIFWRQTACSEQHGKLYSIIINYRDGQINKDEAKKQVLATGVIKNEINTFIPRIKDKINEILSIEVEDKNYEKTSIVHNDIDNTDIDSLSSTKIPVKRGRKPKVVEGESEEAE